MIREANRNDLDEILQLYLYLQEKNCYKMMFLTGSKEVESFTSEMSKFKNGASNQGVKHRNSVKVA